MAKETIYAIYKGDTFLDIGTRRELANKMNIKPETISFLTTPAYYKRFEKSKDEKLIVIKVGKVGDGFEKNIVENR